MTSEELIGHAQGIYQTIEGDFLAFPRQVDPSTVTSDELSLRAFPASRAQLAIVIVDGGFFEVYAKDPDFLGPLRQFKDVRNENPREYFS